MPTINAQILAPNSSYLGRICAFCGHPARLNEQIVICPSDNTVVHSECWQANGNKCTTFGCTGTGTVVAAPAVAAPAVAAPAPAIEWVSSGPTIPVIPPTVKSAPVFTVPAPAPAPGRTISVPTLAILGVLALIVGVLAFVLINVWNRSATQVYVTVVAPTAVPGQPTAVVATQPTVTPQIEVVEANAVATTAQQTAAAEAASDVDNDGLSLQEEEQLGTDPNDPDSDGDRLSDGDEMMKHSTAPLDPDSDNDSLSDGQEVLTLQTNPRDKDTDNDGRDDGVEVAGGSDPLRKATPRPTVAPASPTPPSPITGLRLINTRTDRSIGSLENGDTVSIASAGRYLSVEAVTRGGVGSIVFHLDGRLFCMNPNTRCYENSLPYAMSGDQSGDYYDNWDWSRLSRGTHTITAFWCTGLNATGDCLPGLEVQFTIAR